MSLDHARAYLYRVLPWPPFGDPNAYVNIHWTVPNTKQPGGNDWWRGRACRSIDECIAAITYALKQADTKAIYACMSTQRMANAKTVNSRNGAFVINEAVRNQNNAVQLRSLFIDIDVKADVGYATTGDAALALKEFIRDTGLPGPSLMVKSGTGGLHVYWTLDTALTPAEWQPLANALSEATRRAGLKCDTQCTVDSVRVLRVPGTLNNKVTPPGKVELVLPIREGNYTVEQLSVPLQPYMGATVNTITAMGTDVNMALFPQRQVVADENDELAGGIEVKEARPIVLDTIAPSCGFIAEALATGGANYSNPLWMLTTLAATFAEDGRTMAHAMAKGHPTYTVEDTDAMFDRKLQERQEKNIGWPSCKSIQNAGCGACATCPHLASGGSPLAFGKRATLPAGAQEEDLPNGYVRGSNGLIYMNTVNPDGTANQVLVCSYPMMKGWVQDHPWTLHFDTRLGNTPKTTQVSITLEGIQSREWAKTMGRQGMVISKSQQAITQDFLMSWIKQLQNVKDGVVSASPFGWVMNGNRIAGFSYGGQTFTPTGNTPTASPDDVIARQYGPQGDLSVWQECAKLITDQNRPALDAILALSFGAPLMRFTGEKGGVVSAYSTESGIGKSTTILVAQSVWGHPIRAVQSLDDTLNSVMKKVGELRALPLFWDELKTEGETTKFVKLAFQITGGKEKSRLNADASQRESGFWQTLILAASNDSLLDHIIRQTKSTSAGMYRVFEYVVPPVPSQIPQGVVSRAMARLNDNFGHAGLVYARFLGENFVEVEKQVAELQDRLSKKVNAATPERFWICGMTCMMAGALYANKLGLTNIDTKGLQKFLLECLAEMRGHTVNAPVDLSQPTSIEHVLSQYLGAMRARHTLVTNKIHRTPGRVAVGAVTPKNDIAKLDAIYVHIGEDDGYIRIAKEQFKEWLHDKGYSPYNTVNAMKKAWTVKDVNGRMASGTAVHSHTTEWMIEIDMKSSGLITDGGN